ncbi:MAG: hypothetical protein HRU31_02900 [Rhodobacteraceae bacterium]|nr:hypothetical protein [Paracoccaceae bacterium]
MTTRSIRQTDPDDPATVAHLLHTFADELSGDQAPPLSDMVQIAQRCSAMTA